MRDTSISITKAANGIIVRHDDPEIVARNRKDDGWEDPTIENVFENVKSAMPHIQMLLEKMGESAETAQFSAAFDEATDD